MKRPRRLPLSVLALLLGACGAMAGAAPLAAAPRPGRLPLGARVAGNGKDPATGFGIPAWTGGLRPGVPPARADGGNPFPNDNVLFTIDAGHITRYAPWLTQGVKALLRRYPKSFRLPVYRSRRTTSAPAWVYANSRANAKRAVLLNQGVRGAFGGIPFPILHGDSEARARQAMWNHILRWRSCHVVRRASEVAVRANGDYQLIRSRQEVYFRYYDPAFKAAILAPRNPDTLASYYLSATWAPDRLAGGAVLVYNSLNHDNRPRQVWGYNAGTHRVRRLADLAYDTPMANADGLRTADDTDMFNGAMDKFHWRLVYDHPVERFIPYNNYRLDRPGLSYQRILQPGHINPADTRWELHRVWVVRATLKPGQYHLYSRRRFYLDADSWQIAEADEYDRRGQLWRVSTAYIKNYYRVPTQWSALDVYHDLEAGRYHVLGLDNEQKDTLEFGAPGPSPGYFLPANLPLRAKRPAAR